MSQYTPDPPVALIAEDDDDVRYLLRLQLERGGFEVDLAKDGQEALARFRARVPDLIILDVQMPERSGHEVLIELRRESDSTLPPILFLTGEDSDAAVADGMGLVANDHLANPYSGEALVARAKAAVREKRRTDGLLDQGNDVDLADHTDELTGVSNRRELEMYLRSMSASASSEGMTFTALKIDVDHLGSINVALGRSVGDQTLRVVANRISSLVRMEDAFGRWGGAEFLVLLSMTGTNGAEAVAERIRLAVCSNPINDAQVGTVTVSIGGAEWAPDADVVAIADRALHEAKRKGRNRVTMAH